MEEDTDTEAMQQELREAFRLYDKEGNGYITTDVFRDILHELDDALSPYELDMIIDEVDADGSGTVDFEEFCTLAARFLVEEDSEAMQQELREAFRLYDKEGNGYITTEVFRDILHELDDKLTPQELDMMIEEIDADGSGTLDFD
ncbi:Troponin C, isoform 1, partial [Melipona quadrifasciata]